MKNRSEQSKTKGRKNKNEQPTRTIEKTCGGKKMKTQPRTPKTHRQIKINRKTTQNNQKHQEKHRKQKGLLDGPRQCPCCFSKPYIVDPELDSPILGSPLWPRSSCRPPNSKDLRGAPDMPVAPNEIKGLCFSELACRP